MTRILQYTEAICEATRMEMERDPAVLVMGMGVDDAKAIQGTTKGLVEKFGPDRCFDTPLSEDGMTGVAIGMGMAGLRPIHVHIRMDFALLAMNQLVNMAAKIRYMFGGQSSVPLVVRMMIGKSWGQGPQHSQALHSFFSHVPGLKVVMPTTPYDAKGCLIEAIRDNNPVIYIEHRMLHFLKGEVPEGSYTVPFGQARVMTEGADLTIVGLSAMVMESLRAVNYLKKEKINGELIDPISVRPLDMATILKSVRKTKRLLVVDNGWLFSGVAAEIAARTAEELGSEMKLSIKRMGFADTTCPTAKTLEDLYYPNAKTIAQTAHEMVTGKKGWVPVQDDLKEQLVFRGPF